MKKKFLTVLLAIIAALCLCFGLAACGDTPKDPAGTTPNGQESTENNQDDDGEGGNKETEGDEDTNPDEGGEGTGGDEEPDEGGEGTGGDEEPDEGGEQGGEQNPDEGGEGTGGDETPDEGGEGSGGNETPAAGGEQGGDDDEPCAHQYTVENVCSLCGDEWEYTEGLTYDYDEATDTYTIGKNSNVSGDIVIPYGYQGKFVTKIVHYAFQTNTEIASITIPGSIKTIELEAFAMAVNNLEHISVAKENPIYHSENECLIETQTKTLILGCKNSVIPDSVIAIGDEAFYQCNELADITISDSVTSIGTLAFEGTAYYNDPTHWDKDGVLYIDNHLIKAKPTISGAYTVRAGTKTIAAWAFSGIRIDSVALNLTSIVIPDSVVSIGWLAFGGTGLKDLTIGSGVASIATLNNGTFYGSFINCSELEHITVSDKNTVYKSEGDCLIERQTNTLILGCKNSIIPNSVTSIGGTAFYGCNDLTNIQFEGTVKEWQMIEKERGWNDGTGEYTVTCTDGTADKNDKVTYFEN